MQSEVRAQSKQGTRPIDDTGRGLLAIFKARVRQGKTIARGSGKLQSALMVLCLLAGIACILYPAVSSYFNDRQFDNVITQYDSEMQTVDAQTKQSMLAAAQRYNESLAGDPVHDPFIPGSGFAVPDNYYDVLNVDGKGMMGYINIPGLDINLPIRHTTSDEVLESGAGHIPQTSFPIGGGGTHSVITGHTGLPTARLFSDLIRMKEGDIFIIDVLGDKHAYRVDQIQVVEPEQGQTLHIEAGKEYVTLITCTPYGINSHRLLVRGVPTDMPEDQAIIEKPVPWRFLFAFVVLFAVGCVVWVVVWRYRNDALELRGRCR